MNATPNLCFALADFASTARYEQLSAAAVDAAKKSILDALGVILAASGMEPAVRAVIDFVREAGGRPEASILAFGGRVPAVMAAFANGAMAHCLDYDDQTPWGQHSGSSLLPAVFATAERRGLVSGKEMITAVAVGQDIFNRMRRHVDWRKDWNFSTVMGVFSATAASGAILGLSRDQIAHAFGIASMQCCGTMNVIHAAGSDLRAMYAGFPAKGAVLAASLAEKGVTGVPDIFDGKHGILDLYFGDRYDREAILEDLGTTYTGHRTLYKRWSTVGTAHSHIQATIEIVEIVTRDGRKFDAVGNNIPGSERAPMSWDDLVAKFNDCGAAAVEPPTAARLKEAETLTRTLDSVDDATRLMRILSSPGKSLEATRSR